MNPDIKTAFVNENRMKPESHPSTVELLAALKHRQQESSCFPGIEQLCMWRYSVHRALVGLLKRFSQGRRVLGPAVSHISKQDHTEKGTWRSSHYLNVSCNGDGIFTDRKSGKPFFLWWFVKWVAVADKTKLKSKYLKYIIEQLEFVSTILHSFAKRNLFSIICYMIFDMTV